MAYTLTKNSNYHAGVNPVPGTSSIAVYDSGTITTIPQPGQSSGAKLTDGTQQAAVTATADKTIPGGGNNIAVSQVSTYSGNANGYSLLGE